MGAAAGAGIAFLDATGSSGNLAVLIIFTMFWLGWIIFPLAIPGMSDTSVDPARLEMYPISASQQVLGFALGGLFAPTALFTFLMAVGGSAIPDESLAARVLVVIAALVFALLCVVASRSILALVAGATTSRHGRDIVFIGAGVAMLGIFLLVQTAQDFFSDLAAMESSALNTILVWTPPGAFGSALISLREDDVGTALVNIGYGVLWILAFGALWAWAIRRRVKGGGGQQSQARTRHTDDADLALLPMAMQGFAPTPGVAAAAQQLRYFFFRSPKATQQVVAGVVGGAFLGYQTVASSGLALGTAVFIPVMALTLGLATFNYDDRGFAYLMETGTRLRGVLTGKVIVNWLITLAIMVVFVTVEAAITNSWGDAPAALSVGIAVTSMATGVGALVGVTTPFNQERPGPGRGKLIVGLLGGLAVVGALMVAAGLAFGLFGDGELSLGSGLVSLVVGLALGLLFLRLAGNRVERDPLAIADALGV